MRREDQGQPHDGRERGEGPVDPQQLEALLHETPASDQDERAERLAHSVGHDLRVVNAREHGPQEAQRDDDLVGPAEAGRAAGEEDPACGRQGEGPAREPGDGAAHRGAPGRARMLSTLTAFTLAPIGIAARSTKKSGLWFEYGNGRPSACAFAKASAGATPTSENT